MQEKLENKFARRNMKKILRINKHLCTLNIKPCGLGSRIRDMEAEWRLKVINDLISWIRTGAVGWTERQSVNRDMVFLASTTSEVKKNHAMLSLQILNLSLNSMLANTAVQCELVIFLSSKGEFYDEGFNLINYSNLHWNHMTETSCGCGSCQ